MKLPNLFHGAAATSGVLTLILITACTSHTQTVHDQAPPASTKKPPQKKQVFADPDSVVADLLKRCGERKNGASVSDDVARVYYNSKSEVQPGQQSFKDCVVVFKSDRFNTNMMVAADHAIRDSESSHFVFSGIVTVMKGGGLINGKDCEITVNYGDKDLAIKTVGPNQVILRELTMAEVLNALEKQG